MRIYGIDFTSAPSNRKPLTCIKCEFSDGVLEVQNFEKLATFRDFERVLADPGSWIIGLDFPFGQSQTLIAGLGWPMAWSDYVAKVATMKRDDFGAILEAYRHRQPSGAKQPLRAVDVKANSRSPMMWFGVPVGKMFYEGAPRLLASAASIIPCRPIADESRVVVEAYPALVARRWTGGVGYKADERSKQTPEKKAMRQAIVAGLRSDQLFTAYGFRVAFADSFAAIFVDDASGDTLDSFLSAIQAAWAFTQRGQNYGIPSECRPDEGWIPDPILLKESNVEDATASGRAPASQLVDVTTTYLQLNAREELRGVTTDDADLLVMEAREPSVPFYRFLYDAVGAGYVWTDRLKWSDERLAEYMARPAVRLLVLYVRGTPAGYIELDREPFEEGETGTEIAYFGLIPAFHGRGLGKYLLSVGAARAFDDGASRVWLHTCTLDGPHALANYQGRGFVPYKTTVHQDEISAPGQ